jgi:hypothetical protein
VVVLLGELLSGSNNLDGNKLVTLSLEALDNLTNKTTLDCVATENGNRSDHSQLCEHVSKQQNCVYLHQA